MNESIAPSEPTLHGKPVLPGRYGEVEIEGFLVVTSPENYSSASIALVANEDLLAGFESSFLVRDLVS